MRLNDWDSSVYILDHCVIPYVLLNEPSGCPWCEWQKSCKLHDAKVLMRGPKCGVQLIRAVLDAGDPRNRCDPTRGRSLNDVSVMPGDLHPALLAVASGAHGKPRPSAWRCR